MSDNCMHHCPSCTCPVKKRYAIERRIAHVFSSWEHMADYDDVEKTMEYFGQCVAKVYERKWSDARYRVVDTHHCRIVIESTGVTENTI